MALCASSLALAVSVAPTARAAEPDAANLDLARNVAVTGREAFNVGDFETALALFRRAYALFPAPTIGLYEARTLEKLGLLIEAVDVYSRLTALPVSTTAPAQFAEAIAVAQAEGDALRSRIPKLTLELRGVGAAQPGLTVSVNGRPLSRAQVGREQLVNPGTYRIVGSLGSEEVASAEVTLVPGQSRRVELSVMPSTRPAAATADGASANAALQLEEPSSHPIPTLAYVAGGIGVAGVGAGIITGLLANGHYQDAEELCENRRCPAGSPGIDAVDAFRTWRMVSSVSYGVGAVGIAAAAVLWLTASGDSEAGQVGSIEPWGTAKTAGIRGTF